jgi:hypothetical protein
MISDVVIAACYIILLGVGLQAAAQDDNELRELAVVGWGIQAAGGAADAD